MYVGFTMVSCPTSHVIEVYLWIAKPSLSTVTGVLARSSCDGDETSLIGKDDH